MKRLLLLFLLVPALSFGQKALTFEGKVITYQGSTSLLDAGKGAFADIGGADSTESWAAYGTNTIENDAGALKVTYVDNTNGARINLNASSDLNTNLKVGLTYRIRIRSKVNVGSNVLLRLGNGQSDVLGTVTQTNFTWYESTFVAANATSIEIYTPGIAAGEIIWIDEWTIEEWFPDGRVMTQD